MRSRAWRSAVGSARSLRTRRLDSRGETIPAHAIGTVPASASQPEIAHATPIAMPVIPPSPSARLPASATRENS